MGLRGGEVGLDKQTHYEKKKKKKVYANSLTNNIIRTNTLKKLKSLDLDSYAYYQNIDC